MTEQYEDEMKYHLKLAKKHIRELRNLVHPMIGNCGKDVEKHIKDAICRLEAELKEIDETYKSMGFSTWLIGSGS